MVRGRVEGDGGLYIALEDVGLGRVSVGNRISVACFPTIRRGTYMLVGELGMLPLLTSRLVLLLPAPVGMEGMEVTWRRSWCGDGAEECGGCGELGVVPGGDVLCAVAVAIDVDACAIVCSVEVIAAVFGWSGGSRNRMKLVIGDCYESIPVIWWQGVDVEVGGQGGEGPLLCWFAGRMTFATSCGYRVNANISTSLSQALLTVTRHAC